MENFNNVPSSGTFGSVVSVVNQNFALAKEAIDKLAFSKSACMGFYETSSELNDAHPTPTDGDWALVGNSSPFNVYVANDGSWVDSGVDYNVSVDNSIEINGLGGYVVLDSIQELPASPSNPNLGYLIGDILYVYVGTGGDTADGKYKDCGEFKGGKGDNGNGIVNIAKTSTSGLIDTYTITYTDGSTSTFTVTNGADGHDGVSLGEVAIVNNLTEGGSDKVLSAEMGKELGRKFGGYYKDILAENTQSPKYVNSSGSVANSGTSTTTVAFFPIDGNPIKIKIGKTANSATRVLSFATSANQTTGLVAADAKMGDKQAYEAEISNYSTAYKYLVVCYNNSENINIQLLTPEVVLENLAEKSYVEKNYNKIFDKTSCTIPGSYISWANGNQEEYNGYACTDYIEIADNLLDCDVEYYPKYTGTNSGLAFYDSSKVYISGIKSDNTSHYIKFPANTKYIRFSTSGSDVSFKITQPGQMGFRLTFDEYGRRLDKAEQLIASVLPKSNLHVLMIGNSFTHNACKYLDMICTNLGVDNVTLQYIYQGGSSLQYWSNNLDSRYGLMVGVNKAGIFNGGVLREVLAQEWDIVVFQQVSNESDVYANYVPYMSILINEVQRINPTAKIMFHMTWPYTTRSMADMYQGIIEANKKLKEDYGHFIDKIIPSGTALQNVRATSINTSAAAGFTYDTHHLSPGVGEFVANCTVYASLIQPFTGISLYDDMTTVIDLSSSSDTTEVSVTNENRLTCQKCAMYALIHPWGTTNIDDL